MTWPYGAGTRILPYCPFCDSNAAVIENHDGLTAYCRRCKERFKIKHSAKEGDVAEQKSVTVQSQDNRQLMEFSPEYIHAQLAKVVGLMDKVLRGGVDGNGDYGVIPGTKKPTLFKPGAEKLCMMFRLAPRYKIEREYDGPHLTVTAICELYHIPTDALMGSGIGLCSSKESKYAYRQQSKVCPKCHKETIIKGKAEFGGGWVCFEKKGGCKAKFSDGDKTIESQVSGRVANEDIADQHNTVVKMACKRAYLDATLKATAASSIFTQDQDDSDEIRELRTINEQPEPPPATNGSSPRQYPPTGARAAPAPTQVHAGKVERPSMPFNPEEAGKGMTDEEWNSAIELFNEAADLETLNAIADQFNKSYGPDKEKHRHAKFTKIQGNAILDYVTSLREFHLGQE